MVKTETGVGDDLWVDMMGFLADLAEMGEGWRGAGDGD